MLKNIRGMKDLLFEEQSQYRFITKTCLDIACRFDYREIAPALLEFSEVFEKTLGAGTDIIEKETYSFTDKGGHQVTLRPEGTAGIVRSVIAHKLYQNLPLRCSYAGPMFRYERPQKGRSRQFHQMGVEIFGEPHIQAELELIEMAQMILKELDITNTKLIVNSIGDLESQKNYKKKLVEYLSPFKNDLSFDSQQRLIKNPLRILDSKSKKDQELLKDAPKLGSCLNKESKKFYDRWLNLMSQKGIEFQKSPLLVRGLDYYRHSVFEYISPDLGAQDAFLAGGRYDGLVESMGGPSLSAVGWACGLERILLICSKTFPQKYLFSVLTSDENLNEEASLLIQKIRQEGHCVLDVLSVPNLKKQMKKADKKGVHFVLILDKNEWKNKQIILRNMKTGSQTSIASANIVQLKKLLP